MWIQEAKSLSADNMKKREREFGGGDQAREVFVGFLGGTLTLTLTHGLIPKTSTLILTWDEEETRVEEGGNNKQKG